MLYLIDMVAIAAIPAAFKAVLDGPLQGDRSLLADLEPEQIALLSNDDAAVASLVAGDGAVSMTTRPGQRVQDTDVSLRVAVHKARTSGRAPTFGALTADAQVRDALESTRATLLRRCLLVGPFRLFLMPLALTVVGVARVLAKWQNHRPLTQILLGTLIMSVATRISFPSGRRTIRTAHPTRKALDHLQRLSRPRALRSPPGPCRPRHGSSPRPDVRRAVQHHGAQARIPEPRRGARHSPRDGRGHACPAR